MKQPKSLDFAVIGAQKCATSWMYYCLSDHPQIALPQKKREIDYIGGQRFSEMGTEWFYGRYAASNAIVAGDVSVEYLYDSNCIPELKKHFCKPKFVASIRNPTQRLISSYYWLTRQAVIPNTDINIWIQELDLQNWQTQLSPDVSQVIRRGMYANQLRNYLQNFDASSIYIELFENVKSDPKRAIQSIYRFIGVDDQFVPPNLESQPKKNSYSPILIHIERTLRSRWASHVINMAHQRLAKSAKNTELPVTKANLAKLDLLFSNDIADLELILRQIPETNRPSLAQLRFAWSLN